MSKNTNTGAEIMTENEIETEIQNAYTVHADDADVSLMCDEIRNAEKGEK